MTLRTQEAVSGLDVCTGITNNCIVTVISLPVISHLILFVLRLLLLFFAITVISLLFCPILPFGLVVTRNENYLETDSTGNKIKKIISMHGNQPIWTSRNNFE